MSGYHKNAAWPVIPAETGPICCCCVGEMQDALDVRVAEFVIPHTGVQNHFEKSLFAKTMSGFLETYGDHTGRS